MSPAVVLGGSIAGLLSAAALSTRFDRITIVERDYLPDGPISVVASHRPHTYTVWSAGGSRRSTGCSPASPPISRHAAFPP